MQLQHALVPCSMAGLMIVRSQLMKETRLQDDPSHPGFLVHGVDDTPGRKGYIIIMEAKPGKEGKLEQFLQDIHTGTYQYWRYVAPS